MPLKNLANRTRYRLRNSLGSSRIGFLLMKAWPFWKNNRISQKSTQLCIEGFPRSSNTFLYKVITNWNPDIRIAHHLHVPMQAVYCAERAIPTAVLVRKPEDAIAGAMNRQAWLTIKSSLDAYTQFYSSVLKYSQGILIFTFEDTTKDPSKIVQALNQRHSINLALSPWSKEQEQHIFSMTRNTPIHTEKDEPKKRELKQSIRTHPAYPQALEIYNQTLNKAVRV